MANPKFSASECVSSAEKAIDGLLLLREIEPIFFTALGSKGFGPFAGQEPRRISATDLGGCLLEEVEGAVGRKSFKTISFVGGCRGCSISENRDLGGGTPTCTPVKHKVGGAAEGPPGSKFWHRFFVLPRLRGGKSSGEKKKLRVGVDRISG